MQKLRQIMTHCYKSFLIIRSEPCLSISEPPSKVTELSVPECIQEEAHVHLFGGAVEEILGDF